MAEKLNIVCDGKRLELMVDVETKEQLMAGHIALGKYVQHLQNLKLVGKAWSNNEDHNDAIIVEESETVVPESIITVPDIGQTHGTAEINLNSMNESGEFTSFIWPEAAAKLLIAEYSKYNEELECGRMRKKTVWNAISAKLKPMGFNVSPLQCENKWKAVTRRYKKVLQHNSIAENSAMHCPFEDELYEILHDNARFHPTSVSSSSSGLKSKNTPQILLHTVQGNVVPQLFSSQNPSRPSHQPPSPSSRSSSSEAPSPPPPTATQANTRKRKRSRLELEPAWMKAYKLHQEKLNWDRIEAMQNSVKEFSQTLCNIFETYMGNSKKGD